MDSLKALLQNRLSYDLQCRYSEAQKPTAQSKKHSWEEFGRRLDSNYSSKNKIFLQTFCFAVFVGKAYVPQLPWTIQLKTSSAIRRKSIFLQWREYFEDLLNPVRATSTDRWNWIDFGNRKSLAEMAGHWQKWQQQHEDWNSERLLVKTKSKLKCRRYWTWKELAWFGWQERVRWRGYLDKLQKTGKQVWSFLYTIAMVMSVRIIEEYLFLAFQEKPITLKENTEKQWI